MQATRGDTRSNRVRLTFDVSEEMRREVKIEAVRRGLTVREYLTDLVARDRGLPGAGQEGEAS